MYQPVMLHWTIIILITVVIYTQLKQILYHHEPLHCPHHLALEEYPGASLPSLVMH